MATIPDSVKAQLDADWTGAGGAEPTYYVEEDIRVNPPSGQDWILVMSSTLDTDAVVVNDKYTDEKHILNILVNTLTSEDRLKEISDEIVRILNATAITDITYQRLKRRQIMSGVEQGVFNYQEMITYDLHQQMKSSAAAFGSGTTGNFDVVGDFSVSGDSVLDGDLTVKGGDTDDYLTFTTTSDEPIIQRVGGRYINIESDDGSYTGIKYNDDGTNYCLARYNKASHQMEFYSPQRIILHSASVIRFLASNDSDDYIQFSTAADVPKIDCVGGSDLQLETDTNTIGVDQIAALGMLGSANAAWVPFVLEHALDGSFSSIGGSGLRSANQGANDDYWVYTLPLPTTKGSLKLYIADIRLDINTADATDYVTVLLVQALSNTSSTSIVNDGTDRQAQGQYTYTVNPDVDASAGDVVRARAQVILTTTDELIITGLYASCYYA